MLPPGIPNNEGVFRAITVSAPAGTITNAVLPAACAARGLTGFRMVDCAFGALAMMLPDKVFAASDGGVTGITYGGYDNARNPFIFVEFTGGTWGARPWADGLEGNSNIFANLASQSVEATEAEQPLQILSYEFVADRAGAGTYRGGARSDANTASSRPKACFRCGPTGTPSAPTGSMAAAPASRRAT